MIIVTDDTQHAQNFYPDARNWREYRHDNSDGNIGLLINRIFTGDQLYICDCQNDSGWSYLFVAKYSGRSQYDIVNELYNKNIALPHGILCIAGEGRNFHGFRNRPWAAPAGNIYLTASFAPSVKIDNFGVGFLTLAAVSVAETIDRIPGLKGRAGIKWVNDILIDGAKVCGVLAHTQQEGEAVTSAVLGIGLNVLTSPDIKETPFVPSTAALADFIVAKNDNILTSTFISLINIISTNYLSLLQSGYRNLLDKYRKHSMIIGRDVDICEDLESSEIRVLRSGKITSIGESLELYLVGESKPVSRGRLIIKS